MPGGLPGLARTACAMSALCFALMTGACGLPSKFSLSGWVKDSGGDATPKADSADLISALSTGAFSDDDLFVASMTASTLLARGKGGSWENPRSGARGTITPIAAVYRDNGADCRDFLVSYVHDKAEAWMQGEACRIRSSQWEVRGLRPWRR